MDWRFLENHWITFVFVLTEIKMTMNKLCFSTH